jgi:acetyl-CoA carboxylase biotin carboxylase subunit
MRVVHTEAALLNAVAMTAAEAQAAFGNGALYLEKFLEMPRHVEIQLLADKYRNVVYLGDRDCSVQRRHQKVAEESPSPGVGDDLRQRLMAAAVLAGEAVGYRGAGTVECLVDEQAQDFVFLEMNTRLQVEHPVTEMFTGIDLVEAQLRIACGQDPGFDPDAVTSRGHALEMRVYAEDPLRFLPGPGLITAWQEPTGQGVRVDAAYREGDTVTAHYDPLMAKLVVHGRDRAQALARAAVAVDGFTVAGPKCNLPFFGELLADADFVAGTYDTRLVERMRAPTTGSNR